jgi:alpha-methylacyl-CoA racemase
VVDASIVDGTAHLTTMVWSLLAAGVWQDRRGVNLLDGGAPFYDVYQTSDDRYLAVGPLEPRFFAELMALLGLEADQLPQYDVEGWPQLRRALADAFATRPRDEWVQVFEGSDACVAPVMSLAEAPQHPQLAARDTFVRQHGVLQPAPAPRFSASPARLGGPPPRPGEHSREVLADWAVSDIDGLLASGAVATG